MKSENSAFICVAALVCFLLCCETSATKISLEQAIEQELKKEQIQYASPNNLSSAQSYDFSLKRKRRYLEFPDGSSFQLVYDFIVGVVDFSNYLAVGVTVALAWELPSKPPSEIFDDLSERLKDGTLGISRNDTATNIKYIDGKIKATKIQSPANRYKYKLQPMFRAPMHYQYYTPQTPNGFYKSPTAKKSQDFKYYIPNRYNTWSKGHNNFYTERQKHPFVMWRQQKKLPKFSAKGIRYPWWNLHERLKNSFTSRPSVRRFDENLKYNTAHANIKKTFGTSRTFPSAGSSEHRIYPVFGKRSASAQNKNSSAEHQRYKRSGIVTEYPSKLDRIHIEHHRKTRHDLYQRIETYLNGRGSHGHHCVLRALCETGQRSKEQKPVSFVAELMRAIFTMPEPLYATEYKNQQSGYKEMRYDAANALKEDCATRYNHCKESLWSLHFVI